jgi:hypothetical protein
MQDKPARKRANKSEFALSYLARVLYANLRPCSHGLLHEQADVLRTLFHLASQVGGCGKDEVRVRLAHFHMKVETLDVDLCRGGCLLAESHTLAEFGELGLEVDGQVAWVGKRILGVQRSMRFGHIGAHSGELCAREGPVFGLRRVPVVGGHFGGHYMDVPNDADGIPNLRGYVCVFVVCSEFLRTTQTANTISSYDQS